MRTEGDLIYNGKRMSCDELRPEVAYLLQEDSLHPLQTVRETLSFAATLQHDENKTGVTSAATVEKISKLLGLQKCLDTLIGNTIWKGVSGGERRRTSVGVELLSEPEILFLDEPTSGLDSFAAMKLIEYLKRIALERNIIVVCTIHQPGWELFQCFDRALCLKAGQMLFQGQTETSRFLTVGMEDPQGGAIANNTKENVFNKQTQRLSVSSFAAGQEPAIKFTDREMHIQIDRKYQIRKETHETNLPKIIQMLGLGCPEQYTLADWLLFLAQTLPAEQTRVCLVKTRDIHEENIRIRDGRGGKEIFVVKTQDVKRNSKELLKETSHTAGDHKNVPEISSEPILKREVKPFALQCRELTKRECLITLRHTSVLLIRLLSPLVYGGIMIILFPNNGFKHGLLDPCGGDFMNSILTPEKSVLKGDESKHFDSGKCSAMKYQQAFQSSLGIASTITFYALQGTFFALSEFAKDRPMFLRESMAGMYSVPAVFVAKFVPEIVLTMISFVIMSATMHWGVGFYINFGVAWSIVCIVSFCNTSFAYFLGAFCETVENANQFAPAAILPQFLFSGLNNPIAGIPVWIRWLQYFSWFRISLALFWFYDTHLAFEAVTKLQELGLHGQIVASSLSSGSARTSGAAGSSSGAATAAATSTSGLVDPVATVDLAKKIINISGDENVRTWALDKLKKEADKFATAAAGPDDDPDVTVDPPNAMCLDPTYYCTKVYGSAQLAVKAYSALQDQLDTVQKESDVWWQWLMVIVYFIIFRGLAMLVLQYHSKTY